MGCNCGKKKTTAQPKKVVKPQQLRTGSQNSTLKRIIRRTAR